MTEERTPLWYLEHDRGGELSELDIELDLLDAQIDDERRIQYEQTRARLERIAPGLAARYKPPPRRSRAEQRCSAHPWNDLEAVIASATESELDRLTREHLADKEPAPEPAPVLRRYFSTTFTVR